MTREADGRVIYPSRRRSRRPAAVVGLQGNLAPEGAIVKVAGMGEAEQVFTGPARIFECEEDAFAAVKAREYAEGEVLVIRTEGPAGGPGMREMLATRAAISGQGMGRKWPSSPMAGSRARRGVSFGVGHVGPEAAHGGPIALIRNGDVSTIDAIKGEISVDVSEAELGRAERGSGQAPVRRSMPVARSGNSRRWWVRPERVPSPTPARPASGMSLHGPLRVAAPGAASPRWRPARPRSTWPGWHPKA